MTKKELKETIKKILLIIIALALSVMGIYIIFVGANQSEHSEDICKPVIYLYSCKQEKIQVKLGFKNDKITYPSYNQNTGWQVITNGDGTLTNIVDNKNYSYLFWECKDNNEKYDLTKGFIVKGKDTEKFFQDSLSKMGLQPKEYNEFIVYWLPKMINNRYNLIHFATKDEYEKIYPLEVNPKPDSILRVFMVYKPLTIPVNVVNQDIKPFKRNGLTLIEWGGREYRK